MSSFHEICTGSGISHIFLDTMKNIPLNRPDFPKLYIIKLFIRLRIFYCMKYANRDIKGNKKDKIEK